MELLEFIEDRRLSPTFYGELSGGSVMMSGPVRTCTCSCTLYVHASTYQ